MRKAAQQFFNATLVNGLALHAQSDVNKVVVAGDELKGANAVATDSGKKAIGVAALSADPLGHRATQRFEVRQKVLKNSRDRGSPVRVFPQRKRE